jgi:hypothetical protein
MARSSDGTPNGNSAAPPGIQQPAGSAESAPPEPGIPVPSGVQSEAPRGAAASAESQVPPSGTGTPSASAPAGGPAPDGANAAGGDAQASAGVFDNAQSAGDNGGQSRDALAQLAARNPRPPAPPKPPPLRHRILPRTVIGISCLLLSFAIGAGFSGVVLYSYFQYKSNQTNAKVNALVSGYKQQFNNAEKDLSSSVAAAESNIQQQLKAVQQLQGSPAAMATLAKQLAPSVFFVHTLDTAGQASVGTAFVVSSNSTQSLLLTSYTTVAAATFSPGPPVYVQQGSTQTLVSVDTWDKQYDLALLMLPTGNLPAIPAAPSAPAPQLGDRLYAVSGLGSAGASMTEAAVVDVSSSGLALDAAMGTAFQGGPIVTQSGQVVAVGSRSYSPLGFATNGVWYAPYVEAACSKVLVCPGGTLVGSQPGVR